MLKTVYPTKSLGERQGGINIDTCGDLHVAVKITRLSAGSNRRPV